MSVRKRILLNTFTGWAGIAMRAVLAMVIVPVLLTALGTERYGLIGLLVVLVGLSSVLDLGLRSALGRELAERLACRDTVGFHQLLSSAGALYLGIATILAAVAWAGADVLVTLFNVDGPLRSEAVPSVRLYAPIAIFASFLTPLFSAALTSHNRFDLVNLVQLGAGVLGSLAILVVVPQSPQPLFAWVTINLLQQWIAFGLHVFCFRRTCACPMPSISAVRVARLRPLLGLGGQMYALQMTQTLSENVDPLVLTRFLGPHGVALYQPASRLSTLVRPLVLTLSQQLFPLTTRQHTEQNRERLQRLLILGTEYTLLLGVPVVVGMFFFAEPFCRLWLSRALGPDYRVVASVLKALAVVDLMVYAAGSQWPVLLGMRKLTFLVWIQLPSAVLNVLLSIVLVGLFHLGVPGVLYATIAIALIRRPILVVYTARLCGIRPLVYLRESYLRPAIMLLVLAACSLCLRAMLPITAWGHLALAAGLLGAVWLGLAWCFVVRAEEKTALKAIFQRRARSQPPVEPSP